MSTLERIVLVLFCQDAFDLLMAKITKHLCGLIFGLYYRRIL